MAFLFELAADCGTHREQALELSQHFNGHLLQLSDGVVLSCKSGTPDVWRAGNQHWWCRVVPGGVSLLGYEAPIVTRTELLVEVASQLYERLRQTSAYSCARVGWEVEESLDDSDWDLAKADPFSLPLGTVVSHELWVILGCPPVLEPFGKSSFWKPLTGADYASIVRGL